MDSEAKKKIIVIAIIILINIIMIACTSVSVFKSIKRTLDGEVKIALEEDLDENEWTDMNYVNSEREKDNIENEIAITQEEGLGENAIEDIKQQFNFNDILNAIDIGVILNLVIIVIGIVLIVVGVVLIVKIRKK